MIKLKQHIPALVLVLLAGESGGVAPFTTRDQPPEEDPGDADERAEDDGGQGGIHRAE